MSILYDEGQQAIATESRRVLDARTSKDRLLKLLNQTGAVDAPFWETAVEQGWTALAIPEEHGGLGLGLAELGLVAQATGAATAGAPSRCHRFSRRRIRSSPRWMRSRPTPASTRPEWQRRSPMTARPLAK